MKKLIKKIAALSRKMKIELAVATFLTVCLLAMIPVLAWFNVQRRAAEMFKIKYPNSLFINAAHREDRKFFNLDEIDVKEELNGVPITSKNYVFSVSGASTNEFTLQMAHTNNNGFTYKIYEATERNTANNADVTYELHGTAADPENVAADENKPENTLTFDEISAINNKYYYQKGNLVSGGSYKNLVNANNPKVAKKDASDFYFGETYGTNINVQGDSVPSYWQADIEVESGVNDRQFCKYFILEVSWDASDVNTKETDLIYLSVVRNS